MVLAVSLETEANNLSEGHHSFLTFATTNKSAYDQLEFIEGGYFKKAD